MTRTTLEMITGAFAGQSIAAGVQRLVFGRDPTVCTHPAPDDRTLSRRHFSIDERLRLCDEGSSHGTWCNEERCVAGQPRLLRHGDVVRGGQIRLRVEVHEAPLGVPGYQAVRPIGEGAFGTVWLVRTEGGQKLAMKLLRQDAGADARARFRREMALLQELRHPNVVAVHEVGEVASRLFIVTEFCSGGSLRDQRPSVPMALAWMVQALAGLAFMHEHDCIHRDLKPANILLSQNTARIGDLGLGRHVETSGFTVTGELFGTLAFMPREQLIDFKNAGPPSDVWSMTATLYYLLTGAPPRPFPPGMAPELVVLREPVTPLAVRMPDLPPRLTALVDRGLHDDPHVRPTAAEMAGELLPLL